MFQALDETSFLLLIMIWSLNKWFLSSSTSWFLVVFTVSTLICETNEESQTKITKKPIKPAEVVKRSTPDSPPIGATVDPVDPKAEARLRERWTAFVAEVNKELDFDRNASSPRHVSVVENSDLFLSCAFTKPLRRHRISFLSLKDFSLLFIGQARHTPDKRFSVASTPDGVAWTLR